MDDKDYSAMATAYQGGDQAGFERLVNSLTRPLLAMAYRYTSDWEWARDLTQETWGKVHRRIHDYDPSRSFRAWLFAIHRNGCMDHLRRAWVRYEAAAGEKVLSEMSGVSKTGNPDQDLERREFQRRLLRAVGELSAGQQQVFVRVDIEQGDQREVARCLGMKFTTLRATLHFARKRVADALERMEEPS